MAKQEKTEATARVREEERIFVRELAGKYSELYQQLRNQPRVYKGKKIPFRGGPAVFSKQFIDPQNAAVTQAIHSYIDVYAPGNHSQRHGHMNGAVFYILEGKGYDIHDRVRYDWEAGDACIVENACVHQHFNADPTRPARALIMKGKPAYLFFNLMFQKNVSPRPTEATPGFENFKPED